MFQLVVTNQITRLQKNSYESIVDYLTRAYNMNYKLTLVNEGVIENTYSSKIIKILPKEYESLTVIVKFSKKRTI